MTILLTGASGFVGKYVARELAKRDEVLGVDLEASDEVEAHQLTDFDDAKLAFLDRRISAVVHLAALAGSSGKGGAAESRKNPHPFLNNNVRATLNVLEAMRLSGVSKLVFMSSFSTYGKAPKCPIDEATPQNPDNAYGLSKVMGEQLVRFYAQFGVRSVVLRPTLICGEGQREVNALREFAIAAIEGRPIEVWGKGEHRREFIHPEDVARAIAKSLSLLNGRDGPDSYVMDSLGDSATFVLGNEPVSMMELAQMTGGRIEFKPPGPQAFDQVTDHSKAKRVLGWEPKLGVRQILDRVIADLKSRSLEVKA